MKKFIVLFGCLFALSSKADLVNQRFYIAGDWIDTYNKAALRIARASQADNEAKVIVIYCDLQTYLEQNRRCDEWKRLTYQYNVNLDAFYIGDHWVHPENYLAGKIIANSLKASEDDHYLTQTLDPFGLHQGESQLSGQQFVSKKVIYFYP